MQIEMSRCLSLALATSFAASLVLAQPPSRTQRIDELRSRLETLEAWANDADVVDCLYGDTDRCGEMPRVFRETFREIHELRLVPERRRLEGLVPSVAFSRALPLVVNFHLMGRTPLPVVVVEEHDEQLVEVQHASEAPEHGEFWRVQTRNSPGRSVYVELCGRTTGSYALRYRLLRRSGRWWIAGTSSVQTRSVSAQSSCASGSLVPAPARGDEGARRRSEGQ